MNDALVGKQCWTVDDTDMAVEKMLIIKSPMGSWRAIQALLGFCTLASSLFSNVLPCCSSPCLVRNRENVFLVIDDKGKTVALSLSTLETTNVLCLHRQGQASWQNDRKGPIRIVLSNYDEFTGSGCFLIRLHTGCPVLPKSFGNN